jgi:hypothetical protein
MHRLISLAMLLLASSAWSMPQCPAGTRSGLFLGCEIVTEEEKMDSIAHYTSAHDACTAAYPDKSSAYTERLKQSLSRGDFLPFRNAAEISFAVDRPEYKAILASAHKRMQNLDPAALARDCAQFLNP